jgi:hypothetical protein
MCLASLAIMYIIPHSTIASCVISRPCNSIAAEVSLVPYLPTIGRCQPTPGKDKVKSFLRAVELHRQALERIYRYVPLIKPIPLIMFS